jgi:hypothetical protein
LVKEIECAHCHNNVTPKTRFSSAAFTVLLVLGIIPFILNTVGYVVVYSTVSPILGLLQTIPYPGDTLPPIPPEVIDALKAMPLSIGVMAVATLVLTLVIGILPAIVYWAFRRGTYYCPMCELAI